MQSWIKRSLIGLLGAGIVLGGLSACADRLGHHDRGGEHEGKFAQKMIDRVSSALALTDAQRQKLVLLSERMREQRKALIGTTSDPRAQLQSLVSGAKFDRTRGQAIIDEKIEAIRAKSPDVVAAAGDFFDSLDARQQQQLRDHLHKRHRWSGRG